MCLLTDRLILEAWVEDSDLATSLFKATLIKDGAILDKAFGDSGFPGLLRWRKDI